MEIKDVNRYFAPRTALLSAAYVWRKQYAAKIAAKRHADEIESRLTSTYVSIEDSIRAGNCAPLTESFAADIWRTIGAAGPCAVRADIVLEKRNDTYTHRAISAAMARP